MIAAPRHQRKYHSLVACASFLSNTMSAGSRPDCSARSRWCSPTRCPLHPGSTSLGSDPDVHTFTWTLAWDAHALVRAPWTIFDANIFFPYDRTLAFSENLIGSAIFAGACVWLTGNAVLAMNVVGAAVRACSAALGAYVLARQIGLGRAPRSSAD